ncbi:MAG: YciI family protein [Terracidiphilus sp.]|jgi:hypothetical protein
MSTLTRRRDTRLHSQSRLTSIKTNRTALWCGHDVVTHLNTSHTRFLVNAVNWATKIISRRVEIAEARSLSHYEEMETAAGGIFAGSLESPSHAKSLRKEPNSDTAVTDGPFLEAKEYVGGVWILNCANMDEAVVWSRKAGAACRVSVEIRVFLEMPSENGKKPSQPCRNPSPSFVAVMKADQTTPPNSVQEKNDAALCDFWIPPQRL